MGPFPRNLSPGVILHDAADAAKHVPPMRNPVIFARIFVL